VTARQTKHICWLSGGRRVVAVGNISLDNPKLLFGSIDTDPRELVQPDLDDFLRWWKSLETHYEAQGVQAQFHFSALGECRAKIP